MKLKIKQFFLFLTCVFIFGAIDSEAIALQNSVEFSLSGKQWIPAWLVLGPVEQEIVGLSNIGDKELINESKLTPKEGDAEESTLVNGKLCYWKPQSVNVEGFLDFNATLSWIPPGKIPRKIWWAKEGYAVSYIKSESEQDVNLLLGSDARIRVFFNYELVFSSKLERDAVPDNDVIKIHLNKGENILLIRVSNSHKNLLEDSFGGTGWGWGFFARLLDLDNKPLENIKIVLPVKTDKGNFGVVSTLFFKKSEKKLLQRFDVVINSRNTALSDGKFLIKINKRDYNFTLNNIPYGESRHAIFLPELQRDTRAHCVLKINSYSIKKSVELKKRKHYELHFMMLSHMDIGYTNPQPVVKERHIRTLDDVLEMCGSDPDFKWTIETTWMLEQYELAVPHDRFEKLMGYIKSGRISLSPVYSNPYTGWIGVEEMIHAFARAQDYYERYKIKYPAAIYDDLPGASWILPQLFKNFGTKFFVCGINEIYSDYNFQKALPKVFYWEGSDHSKVLTYLTDAYNEGRDFGMEKGVNGVEIRLWGKLSNLEAWDYPYELVLINAAYADNSGIPKSQFAAAKEWNKHFEYPKIVVSTLDEFSEEFAERYGKNVPTIKGDWTSDWDILAQSEPQEFIQHRLIQHKLLSAEKLSTLNWLIDSKHLPFRKSINDAHSLLLNFSGHGSGLEFGFGTPEENAVTMAFRENYLNDAELKTEEVLERSIYRFCAPHFSFASEGIIIFNPLSWNRDVIAEVNFSELNNQNYDIIDLTANKALPCFRNGHKLRFVARNLPSFGYKKYKLVIAQENEKAIPGDLVYSDGLIENKFYRIKFDSKKGKILQIIDKKTGNDFVKEKGEFAFNEPIRERASLDEFYCAFPQEITGLNVIDERPLRLILELKRDDQLFEKSEYILWENLDRIDITNIINISALKSTKTFEEYGVAFPFNLENSEARVEIIGGFLNPEQDRFPGIKHDAYSMRRAVAFYNRNNSVSWTTADSRVIRIRKEKNSERNILISNIVNNFPKNWNRNQKNQGRLTLRYSFSSQEGGFRPEYTGCFGWDFATSPIVQRGWYNEELPQKSFLEIDNDNIILLTLKSLENENSFALRLTNVNPYENEKAIIKSEFFTGQHAYYANIMWKKEKSIAIRKNSFNVMLRPNEIITVMIEKEKLQKGGSKN